MKLVIVVFILVTIFGVNIMGCSAFGTRPDKEEKNKFFDSKQFNSELNIFQNRRPNLMKEMRSKVKMGEIFKEWFFSSKENLTPKKKLPETVPDFKQFVKYSNEPKAIWLGHSTILVNIEGKIILIDPIFSQSASPFSWLVKRFQDPVVKLEELPKIHYIVISHDHYDHLDMETIKFFKDMDVNFITPLGVGSHLKGWGISADQIIEKDWWQSHKVDGIEFIATPAQHFSGRDGLHDNETLWASWVIKSNNHRLYFSGDSGYDTHFKEIGEKYGPFDAAFIESGQYDPRWSAVHMLPKESAMAYKDLKAKKYFPIHWGMFKLAFHTWYDPMDQLVELSERNNIDLITTKIGEVVYLEKENKIDTWWKNF